MTQLKHPLDPQSKKIIENTVDEFLKDKIFDIVWRDFFYYFTNFESIDGYNIENDTTGSVSVDATEGALLLGTGTTANTFPVSATLLNNVAKTVLDWSKKQRARFTVKFSVTDTSAEEYVAVGFVSDTDSNGSPSINGYGFYVDTAAVLYGVMGDGTTTTKVQLLTSANGNSYELEVRYDPNRRNVIFFVDGTERGSLQTTFPTDANRQEIFYFWIMTDGTTNREISIYSAEYIEQK